MKNNKFELSKSERKRINNIKRFKFVGSTLFNQGIVYFSSLEDAEYFDKNGKVVLGAIVDEKSVHSNSDYGFIGAMNRIKKLLKD